MLQLFIASFCDQTDIEGNGCNNNNNNMTNAKKLKQQALLKLKKQGLATNIENGPNIQRIISV